MNDVNAGVGLSDGDLEWLASCPYDDITIHYLDAVSALVAEVRRLRAELDEEHRWSRGWRDLARRKEVEADEEATRADGFRRERDRLRDGIREHRSHGTTRYSVADARLWALLDDQEDDRD